MDESCSFPTTCFIVLCPLSTMWSAETGPPTDSKVVVPFVQAFLFPASPSYEHPSRSFESGSVFWSVLPCAIGCSHNHDSKVTTCAISVGGPARSDSLSGSFAQPVCMTPNFILAISSSNLALLLLSLIPTSSSSRSLILSHRMASHDR